MWAQKYYPYPFSLEPLSLETLACFVYAEMPEIKVPFDKSMAPELADLLTEVRKTMTAKFLGGMLEIDVDRVGALYQEIIDLISDEELIPNSMFDAESYEFQASWDEWGRSYKPAPYELQADGPPGRPRRAPWPEGSPPASSSIAAFSISRSSMRRERRREAGRWRLMIDIEGRVETLETDFLAEAGGRGGALAGRRTGAATLAVFAYWRAARLPETPLVEAGDEAWFWCVPLPNGVFNTLAFVDPKTFRSAGSPLEDRFKSLLARSRSSF